MYDVAYLILLAVVMFVMAIAFLIDGYHKLNRYHLILDTPTSRVRSLALGLVQVKGSPYNPEFIKTPHSHSDCVYYKFNTYELQILDPAHPYLTREWYVKASGEDETDFYVNDGTGYVLIKPEDAEHNVRLKKVLYEPKPGTEAKLTIINRIKSWLWGDYKLFKMTETGFYEFEPWEKIPFSIKEGDRMIHETYIGPDDRVYVLGTAKHDEDAHNMVYIEKGNEEPTFILSDRSEESLIDEHRNDSHSNYKAGAVLLILSIIVFFGGLVFA